MEHLRKKGLLLPHRAQRCEDLAHWRTSLVMASSLERPATLVCRNDLRATEMCAVCILRAEVDPRISRLGQKRRGHFF